jgi:hypothetical protein
MMLVAVCVCVWFLCCGASSLLDTLPKIPTLQKADYKIGQNGRPLRTHRQ